MCDGVFNLEACGENEKRTQCIGKESKIKGQCCIESAFVSSPEMAETKGH